MLVQETPKLVPVCGRSGGEPDAWSRLATLACKKCQRLSVLSIQLAKTPDPLSAVEKVSAASRAGR